MEPSNMRWKFQGLHNLLKKTVARYDKNKTKQRLPKINGVKLQSFHLLPMTLDRKWHWPQGGAQNAEW